MTCKKIETMLAALALGELSRNEQRSVDAHLEQCPACSAKAARIRSEARRVAGALACKVDAPAGMLEGVERRIRPLAINRSSAPRWAVAAAAALVLGVLGVAAYRSIPKPDLHTAPVHVAADAPVFVQIVGEQDAPKLTAFVQSVKRDKPGIVASHISADVAFLPIPIEPRVSQAKFVGGKQCCLDGERVAAFLYEVDGQPVILYQTPRPIIPPSTLAGSSCGTMEFWTQSRDEVNMVVWPHADTAYVLAGRVPLERLLEFASASATPAPLQP